MDADVIILGGGLAGMAAAARLGAAGRSVLLLEARPWLGGRVRSHRVEDLQQPIELGAEWVPSAGEVADLLRAGLATLEVASGTRLVRRDGRLHRMEDLPEIAGELEDRIARLPGDDRSLLEALELCCSDARFRRERDLMLAYVQGFHAADPARLSVRWLRTVDQNQPADASDSRVMEGSERIVELLRTAANPACRFRTECVVRQLHWQPGRIEVAAVHQGTEIIVRARAAVVTLPLPLLQADPGTPGAVAFRPTLEGRRPALDRLAMGPACKLVLRFREPFWEEEKRLRDMLFLHAFDAPFPTWWTLRPAHVPLLSAWAGGPQTAPLRERSTASLVDLALESFARASGLPRQAFETELTGWHYHDWNADPFSRGAYSYVAVGGLESHRLLAEPVAGTLFFAGEATCGQGYNATMEGAVASGHRAAAEVLQAGA